MTIRFFLWQADVVDLKEYHDRHGDLLSAGRANDEEDIWGGGGEDASTLPEEVIEGMPADWLQRQLGDETARQASRVTYRDTSLKSWHVSDAVLFSAVFYLRYCPAQGLLFRLEEHNPFVGYLYVDGLVRCLVESSVVQISNFVHSSKSYIKTCITCREVAFGFELYSL